jgi:hypothetical protein
MHTELKDRASVTAVYPFEVFEAEAAQNSRVDEITRHGLLIEDAPEADGSLRVRRAAKSIGDPPEGPEALFVCPYMGRTCGYFALRGGSEGAVKEKLDIFDPHPEEDKAFINTVIALGKDFRPLPPLDHARLPKG